MPHNLLMLTHIYTTTRTQQRAGLSQCTDIGAIRIGFLAPFLSGFVIRKFMRKCKWTFKWNYHSYAAITWQQNIFFWWDDIRVQHVLPLLRIDIEAAIGFSAATVLQRQTDRQIDGRLRYHHIQWMVIKTRSIIFKIYLL